jgi:hypothetical protein
MEFRPAQFICVHEGDSADLRLQTSGLGAFQESVEPPRRCCVQSHHLATVAEIFMTLVGGEKGVGVQRLGLVVLFLILVM